MVIFYSYLSLPEDDPWATEDYHAVHYVFAEYPGFFGYESGYFTMSKASCTKSCPICGILTGPKGPLANWDGCTSKCLIQTPSVKCWSHFRKVWWSRPWNLEFLHMREARDIWHSMKLFWRVFWCCLGMGYPPVIRIWEWNMDHWSVMFLLEPP